MKKVFLPILILLLLVGNFRVTGTPPICFDDIKPAAMLKSSVTLKANLYSGDQDEESSPITNVKFYLLDQDLPAILKNAGFKPELEGKGQQQLKREDYLTAVGNTFASKDTESAWLAALIEQEISKHTRCWLKTNDFGQANSQMIEQGNYHLFGIYTSYGEIFVWSLPVEIKVGDNLIEIDQYNAQVF